MRGIQYGEAEFDAKMQMLGLNRLFLHAYSIRFTHPKTGEEMVITAPLDKTLKGVLAKLRQN